MCALKLSELNDFSDSTPCFLPLNMTRMHIWIGSLLAAAISGASGGMLTGFAAVGIDPQHFNLQAGSPKCRSQTLLKS
jgi:hypothetical protein